jgi:hypothetical protein
MIGWRKFSLAAFFALAGTGLAAFDKLGADYVGLATLVLSAYGFANVASKKAGQAS